MSVLAKIRGEVLSNLDQPDVRVRKAIINLFDAIDSDLDVGYTPSTMVEDALDEYNNALAGMEDETEEEVPPITKLGEVEVRSRDDDEDAT